jgi:hypothetical protein
MTTLTMTPFSIIMLRMTKLSISMLCVNDTQHNNAKNDGIQNNSETVTFSITFLL